jgi:hypothetical protein
MVEHLREFCKKSILQSSKWLQVLLDRVYSDFKLIESIQLIEYYV